MATQLLASFQTVEATGVEIAEVSFKNPLVLESAGRQRVFKKQVTLGGKPFSIFTSQTATTQAFVFFSSQEDDVFDLDAFASLKLFKLINMTHENTVRLFRALWSTPRFTLPELPVHEERLNKFVEKIRSNYDPDSPYFLLPKLFKSKATVGDVFSWIQTLFEEGEPFVYPKTLDGATCPKPKDNLTFICRLSWEKTLRGYGHILVTSRDTFVPGAPETFYQHSVLYF